MPILATHSMLPDGTAEFNGVRRKLIGSELYQAYNCLDCCVTYEVFKELRSLYPSDPMIYNFERALQAPVLEMMLRGFRVDEYERQKGIESLRKEISRLDGILQKFAFAIWSKGLNPRSPKQLIDFFYSAMKLPEVWISLKGQRKLSTNREALEKLELYFHARPIIACILTIRDLGKKLSVLETEVSADGRMRTSYNIAGTETGRWSSSSSADGTGTNLQNIAGELRKIFISDEGWKLCGIDLEQAESREVGWLCGTLFGDWSYLDACYAGDLHTTVCRMTWKDLPWNGEKKHDREIADQIFYREYSYRDMAKKLGHGSNYFGRPFTMARHAKIPVHLAEAFQKGYFTAFPGIPKWHQHVAQSLQTQQKLVTPWGRERHFFGRPGDDTTLREAIAFAPQSATGDRTNLALYRLWQHFGSRIRITAQVHDAIYFQYRETDDEDELLPEALNIIDIRTSQNGRELIVPGECKTGYNWGNFSDANPDGLKKWKSGQKDDRKRTPWQQRTL